jgi:hypothetical protein
MPTPRTAEGKVAQAERPNWQPLEDLVGEPVVGQFMWMFEVELRDGSLLQAYKHVDTRQYIHLDAGGTAFVYEPPDWYRVVGAAEVLAQVFASLPRLAGVTSEQIRESHEALERLVAADADSW